MRLICSDHTLSGVVGFSPFAAVIAGKPASTNNMASRQTRRCITEMLLIPFLLQKEFIMDTLGKQLTHQRWMQEVICPEYFYNKLSWISGIF